MSLIKFECVRCGSKIVTRDAAEALAWDQGHDAVCTNPAPKEA
jgi:hypothetical protein